MFLPNPLQRMPLSLVATTLAVSCSAIVLNSVSIQAQTLDLGSGDDFLLVFIGSSPVGATITQGPATLIFDDIPGTLNPVAGFLPTLTVTTNQTALNAVTYRLDFQVTTGSNGGFLPAGITIGGQLVNGWVIDLGGLLLSNPNSVNFQQPITYTSAMGSWFDNGNLVFQTSYLTTILDNSTPTELSGLFTLSVPAGSDLGAFGNGIDTFSLSVNVTLVPESRSLIGLLAFGGLLYRIAEGKRQKVKS